MRFVYVGDVLNSVKGLVSMKSAVLSVFGLWLVLAAGSAFAAEPSYLAECTAAATAKFRHQAASRGAALVAGSVKVTYIDDRILNPYKYVWFKAIAKDQTGAEISLKTMTQKSYFPIKACF